MCRIRYCQSWDAAPVDKGERYTFSSSCYSALPWLCASPTSPSSYAVLPFLPLSDLPVT